MTRAFLFPGQGSQAVGMGKALADAFLPAREVFQEVDDALSQKLSRLMWEGPESDLTLTENAQPAIMAFSVAIIRVLQKEAGMDLARAARLVAGHSLGEYSALSAAGAFTLADTARLLKTRGQAMQSAVPVGEGAMTALIGADIEVAEAVAKEAAGDDVCVVANDNAPGQVVLSGAKAAMDRVPDIAKTKGVKRAIPLSVSAPFHCSLMQPAADVMAEALAEVNIRPLAVPVLSNVTAQEASDPETVRRLLVEQVTSRVRWRESMLALKELGVDTTVEMGGNKVLTGMMRRIDKDIQAISLDTPAEIEAFAKGL
ncbi:MAG TPA: ACP S-malonyltransferase [Rhizomicrobium sp.]|jgi:[acyl-carrier-protein] S-malonyltransferase|nr:ACP S-malonyltransferase [Rhizomicrobium sp.]